ncbi:MAG: hypothetical protein GY711_28945 [bacterium]|nr:hypothetical protein [bacterium]
MTNANGNLRILPRHVALVGLPALGWFVGSTIYSAAANHSPLAFLGGLPVALTAAGILTVWTLAILKDVRSDPH